MLFDWGKEGSAATQQHAIIAVQDAIEVIKATSDHNVMLEELKRIRAYVGFSRLPGCDWGNATIAQLETYEAQALQAVKNINVSIIGY
ncbi:hypothetical protein [Marinobacterium weihaiense]|uniref:Uncharacterized protein n=1 Tax=Marinobacterium weihaiense TaxID=2851016 RepID=A0ABS6MCW4_9GAMM|nr:hypothetical protein [Marinobacterium weihaiense]MBV0934146.1 hypothetical protein [Marinobacterium weihaiense]